MLHLPVRGNGDGGIYTSADDLHRFWRALTAGRIVAPETVAELIRPRYDVPSEGLRYGMGFWLHPTGPAIIMEGGDAGVSFRSSHNPQTETTVTVFGNSSDGAMAGDRGAESRPRLSKIRSGPVPGAGTCIVIIRCHSACVEAAVRTTLALDDDLVAEAQRLTGTTEKTALVRQALYGH